MSAVLFVANKVTTVLNGISQSVLNGGPIPVTLGFAGRVALFASGGAFSTGGTTEYTVQIFVDGVASGPEQIVQVPSPLESFDGTPYSIVTVIGGLSIGTHTFDVQATTQLGGVTIFGGGGLIAMSV